LNTTSTARGGRSDTLASRMAKIAKTPEKPVENRGFFLESAAHGG
jgi:hypothetical protein